MLYDTQPHTRGMGYDRPNYSYLQDTPKPRPQFFAGDHVVLDAVHPDQVLHLLSEEDGLVMGPDGKWRSVGAVAMGDPFDEATAAAGVMHHVSDEYVARHRLEY